MKNKLTKTAAFTDIHWGAKTNSEQHNQDCMDYIDWFCNTVRSDQTIDNIIFLGDWFENRAALNISTMNWSYKGAKKINDLGLPVYFIVGNHDLYHRHTRAVFSTVNFHEFSNFNIISEPTIVEEINNGVLLCPFLFHDEYKDLIKHTNLDTWWGHFEFQGFMVTGYGMKMPTGPTAVDFAGPKYIMSGHFHKRQYGENVVYIGNTFPTNFGDAGDNERGLMVYDHVAEDMTFQNWDDCPKYTKTTLTNLLDGTTVIHRDSRVKCVADVPITYEESAYIKQKYTEDYSLREFTIEESNDIQNALTATDTDEIDEMLETEFAGATLDELVIQMLGSISSEHIDNARLVEQYRRLTI